MNSYTYNICDRTFAVLQVWVIALNCILVNLITSAISAQKPLYLLTNLRFTSGNTLERNPINVICVRNGTPAKAHWHTILKYTLEKNLTSVRNVKHHFEKKDSSIIIKIERMNISVLFLCSPFQSTKGNQVHDKCFCACSFQRLILLNLLWHMLHWCDFSPVCIRLWTLRRPCFLSDLLHLVYLNGLFLSGCDWS